jgi:hypothetical protein
MKVVCQADEGDWLLIIPGDSLEAALNEDSPRARALWRSQNLLTRPLPLYRLLETREWEERELPDAELRELLSQVEVEGSGINEPWVF